jgi:hypothetical protein
MRLRCGSGGGVVRMVWVGGGVVWSGGVAVAFTPFRSQLPNDAAKVWARGRRARSPTSVLVHVKTR